MIPIPQPPGPRCDCCGLPAPLQPGDFCPRCGYPVSLPKEEQFLEESIRNLQRVVTYGGAQATVSNLLLRYQNRLSVLRRQLYEASLRQSASPALRSEVVLPPPVQQPIPSLAQVPLSITTNEQASFTPPAQPAQPENAPISSAPQQMFSLRSFFADQTINIVSSLGAFLILAGSLSFVATTSNLFLSFLMLFIVHLLFATAGFVFTRFPGFHFIARIYIAIFALLIPLVSFSGYRLVAGHLIQLSAPTVVAIASAYAAIVYGILAITQQYKPFGYLAGVALVLADCAIAFSLRLHYEWWPVLLIPLAFVALFSMGRNSELFSGNRAVLREPTRILMYACVGVLCLDLLYTYTYVLAFAVNTPFTELRIVNAVIFSLVLIWTCAYLVVTKRFAWLAIVPYQFFGFAVAIALVFNISSVALGVLFTAVAVFYHIVTLVARTTLQRFPGIRGHMEQIALVVLPFILLLVAPLLPLQVLQSAFSPNSNVGLLPNGDAFLALVALGVSCVLTVSIMLHRTGLRRIPTTPNASWPRLLLLTGFLFTWVYSINVLLLHIAIDYAFVALTLVLLVGTIVVRRFISTAWSSPLDVVVLLIAGLTLLLHIRQDVDTKIALLILFSVLSYTVLVYQRRSTWLFVPLLFMLFALPLSMERPHILLLLGVGLPLVATVFAKIEQSRTGYTVTHNAKTLFTFLFTWQWPLLVSGLLYGVLACSHDAATSISTVQNWIGVPFSVALEMAVLALVWYIVAAVTRQQWLLLVPTGFAIAGLLVPSNPLWIMASIASIAALVAVGMGRIVAKPWVAPLYAVALLAAVLVGIGGYTGGHEQLVFVSWTLLGFAVLLYAIGVVENFVPALWLASAFAIWSAYDAATLGNLYYPPVVALLCAAIGVGIGSLALAPKFTVLRRSELLQLSLPLYVTALAAAVLTGVYGTLGGINAPFPTAIPDALLLYAGVAYAVLVFERQPRWLWLVAVFALWGVVLEARLNPDLFYSIDTQILFPTYYLTGVVLVTGIIALVAGRLSKTRDVAPSLQLGAFTWSWPWYCASLFAVVVMVTWNTLMGGIQVSGVTVYGSLFAFMLLSFIVMFVEQRGELIILPLALALWGIVQTRWEMWQQLGVLSLLFFLVFAMPYIWQLFPAQSQSLLQRRAYILVGFAGQVGMLLLIIAQGGLFSNEQALAHVGIGVLLLLAVQLFWYGWAQQAKQYWTIYVAGLLLTLAIPWQLSTFQITRIEWLTLAPATYLIVVAPFLSHNEHTPYHTHLGQLCSILGASLLLLPTLWSSFSEPTIQPTFILTGEALFLLLLGVTLRTRIFVLSGAALVIVSAMHALFLPSLGLPPSLALTIMGGMLLALATALSLARHRLQSVWTRLD